MNAVKTISKHVEFLLVFHTTQLVLDEAGRDQRRADRRGFRGIRAGRRLERAGLVCSLWVSFDSECAIFLPLLQRITLDGVWEIWGAQVALGNIFRNPH